MATNLRLSEDLAAALREEATRRGRSQQDIVREAAQGPAVTGFPTAITAVTDDLTRQREQMRSWLALLIVGLVFVSALLLIGFIYNHGGGDDAKLLVTGVFTPVIGIAGTVLGFYFGSKEKD